MTTIQILTIVSGILLPAITQLITRTSAPVGIKVVTSALLVGAVTVLGGLIAGGDGYDLKSGIITAVGTAIAAIASHYGLLKPTGIDLDLARHGVKDKTRNSSL